MDLGMFDIKQAIDVVNGRQPNDAGPPSAAGVPDHRWVIVISVVEPEGEMKLFDEVFGLVSDAVTSLRNGTGVAIPDAAIERVQPMYTMALQHGGGEIVPHNLAIVEHVLPGPPRPASGADLEAAEELLLARLRQHPIEQCRTFSTKARIAGQQDGNYESAIINAAIACELLIETSAWMVSFEASLTETDPASAKTLSRLGDLRPSQLIGQVLQPRLKGSWDSMAEGCPVREWRVRVAQKRNALLHLGRHASSQDAAAAVHAMSLLETHMLDRLAERGNVYPRTAYALVGPFGLERRGQLLPVLAAVERFPETPDDWIASYAGFVTGLLDESA